jgi:hypothetical protein
MGCWSSRHKIDIQKFDYSPTKLVDGEYQTPFIADMAVCLVYFNFCKSKRLLMNYLFTVEKLKTSNIPYFTLELYFDKPEIHGAFHLRGKSALFHKERLCRILEKMVPEKYDKIVFIDADIIFRNARWYNEVSEMLTRFQVVQPFERCAWMDSTYKTCLLERQCVMKMQSSTYDTKYHPGFAWAFQREWFQKNGFYDYAITGSGDTLSAAAWLNVDFPPNYLQPALRPSYDLYRKNITIPSMSYATGVVEHLWHGTRENRQYVNRHKILEGVDDVRNILTGDVLEVTDSAVRIKMEDYFRMRDDDGI